MGFNLFSGFSKKKEKQSNDQSASTSGQTGPGSGELTARAFRFHELVAATKSFTSEIGKGGFGVVYKGSLQLEHKVTMGCLPLRRSEGTNQIVAIKTLDRSKQSQGTREFLVEILMFRLLQHPNVVTFKGYCAEGDQRMLVYEYMPSGSLAHHLFEPLPAGQMPLDWNTRMKIAAGAAKGLEYMHNTAKPPVIYRDMKGPNILLDEDYNPKLSDFGLSVVGPVATMSLSTRIVGTDGYCAPEYRNLGKLTLECDIYSFGVVLLEIITGRVVTDESRPEAEKELVPWARSLFRDPSKYMQMADPNLYGLFPNDRMEELIAIAAMCTRDQPALRPPIADVALALNYLASLTPENSVQRNVRSGSASSSLSLSKRR